MADITFEAAFDVDGITVRVEDLERLTDSRLGDIISHVNTFGFAVVDRPHAHDPEAQILALGRHFGGVVMHDKSSTNGITVVRSQKDPLYLSQSNAEHELHTDCTYLHTGFARIVLLQCVQPCPSGGDSILFSGLKGYRYLQHNHPSALQALRRGNIKFRRGDSFGERPVFGNVGTGRVGFTYRRDTVSQLTFDSPETEQAYEILSDYMRQPENQLTFKMEKNQILIMDNTAIAHGRTTYSPESGRVMHRLQMNGAGAGLHLGIASGDADRHDRSNASVHAPAYNSERENTMNVASVGRRLRR